MAAHILIIEDNEASLDLVRYLLQHHGYTTVEAIDGESGIDRASTDRPDLVLCDLQLPGIDRLGVVRAIRKQSDHEDPAVIAVTALPRPSDRDRLGAAGVNGY